jgi:uncharacterized protein with LGFP repeats
VNSENEDDEQDQDQDRCADADVHVSSLDWFTAKYPNDTVAMQRLTLQAASCTPETGAHEVHGAIRDKWQQRGWERSKLRYPVNDEHDIPGGRASNFQGGEIQWTPTGGPVVRKSQRLD